MKNYCHLIAALLCVMFCSSCAVDYVERATSYKQQNSITTRYIVKEELNNSPRFILCLNNRNLVLYDLQKQKENTISKMDSMNSFEMVQDTWHTITFFIHNSDNNLKFFTLNLRDRFSVYEQNLGTICDSNDNYYCVKGMDGERYKISRSTGESSVVLSIEEYLMENKISQSDIHDLDHDANVLVYSKYNIFEGNRIIHYNANFGVETESPLSSSFLNLSPDKTLFFLDVYNDDEHKLMTLNKYSGEINLLASGASKISKVLEGGYLVKQFDLSEIYFDPYGNRGEKPREKGFFEYVFGL